MFDIKIYSRSMRVMSDLLTICSNPKKIPVVYFTEIENIGDLINEFLIPKISGRGIVKVRSSALPHLRAVGSVIGSASHSSHIWGGGSIDGRYPRRKLDIEKIYALRGTSTKAMIEAHFGKKLKSLPLGDPGLLMPMFFQPNSPKKVKVGIVPHFSDERMVKKYLSVGGEQQAKIISVRQRPEDFISEIVTCDFVFSSSLHGLVLADSYQIPNQWVKFSDNLLGGSYKFLDYYSTTDSPFEKAILVSDIQSFVEMIRHGVKKCRIKNYTGNLEALRNSFPAVYMKGT